MNTKEIQDQIDWLHAEIEKTMDLHGDMMITPRVLQKHAKIVDLTSQLAEAQTRRIVNLTRWLCALTCCLLAVAAVQVIIMLVQEFHHFP